jgi:hypothetical protein
MSQNQIAIAMRTEDATNITGDIRYLISKRYIDYYYPNGRNTAPDTTKISITADGEDVLGPLWIRDRQIAMNFLGIMGSLIVGAMTSWLSVHMTNKSNLDLLEPHISISFQNADKFGIVHISSGMIPFTVENIGPSQIQDLEISINTFDADFGLSQILYCTT